MVALPRLVIAAPASGCGKTTVATGLMAACRARGLAVSGHKVGPDYIDPGYHALATGRPGRNLDAYLCGEQLIEPLLRHGAIAADIAIIEGVMGLFDGAADRFGGACDFASTAHVATLLRAPVVLVVDAASVGRSVAALVAGFAGFDPDVRIGGVILNRVGSQRHERLLREAIEPLGIGVYGAIRRVDGIAVPSRHLGLIPAAERRGAAARTIAGLAALVAESCDVEGLVALAKTAPALSATPWEPNAVIGREPADPDGDPDTRAVGDLRSAPPVVAVAHGPAFTFSYTEHVELLAAAGAEVALFDPLADETLPPDTAGVVIGGGFPEVHAPQLSANERLRARIAKLSRAGAPVVAECAGLLYLARTLDGAPMCGVLDAEARMTDRLTLGYRSGAAVSDSVLARIGERVHGHEFHRTVVDPGHGERPAWQWAADGPEGFVRRNVVASYLHLHWAGRPHSVRRFVAACRSAASGSPASGGAA